mmetsp:Transcript_117971/g.334569  ORF Transcript_117971/g.334569 Transcript_117971/m.334569 type:complete len:242 (-) Transcript_117971:1000-1725(-)
MLHVNLAVEGPRQACHRGLPAQRRERRRLHPERKAGGCPPSVGPRPLECRHGRQAAGRLRQGVRRRGRLLGLFRLAPRRHARPGQVLLVQARPAPRGHVRVPGVGARRRRLRDRPQGVPQDHRGDARGQDHQKVTDSVTVHGEAAETAGHGDRHHETLRPPQHRQTVRYVRRRALRPFRNGPLQWRRALGPHPWQRAFLRAPGCGHAEPGRRRDILPASKRDLPPRPETAEPPGAGQGRAP